MSIVKNTILRVHHKEYEKYTKTLYVIQNNEYKIVM